MRIEIKKDVMGISLMVYYSDNADEGLQVIDVINPEQLKQISNTILEYLKEEK